MGIVDCRICQSGIFVCNVDLLKVLNSTNVVNVRERGALAESVLSDLRNAVGQSNLRQRGAVIECKSTDFRNARMEGD